jgi:hypothetical protein
VGINGFSESNALARHRLAVRFRHNTFNFGQDGSQQQRRGVNRRDVTVCRFEKRAGRLLKNGSRK